MDKALRQAMIKILEDLARDSSVEWIPPFNTPPVARNATTVPYNAGHLASLDDHPIYRITLSGFNYLEELKHPVRTWLKRNWFAATVAVATLLLALVSSVAQAVAAFC